MDDITRGLAMNRAAEAFLRVLGGTTIQLRLLAGTTGDADLGLAAPIVEDVTIGPAVTCRGTDGRTDVLVAASTLRDEADHRAAGSVEALINGALGVVVGGKFLRVESISSELFAGAAYLYRITATE